MSDSAQPMKNRVVPFGLEVLTPLHIGSGSILKKGFEFVGGHNETIIVPQSVLFQYLEENPQIAKDIANNDGELKEVLKTLEDKRPEGVRTFPTTAQGNDIHEFLRDGWDNPILPGSSIKGAVRTVLLREGMKQRKDIDILLQKAQKKLDVELSDKIFGEDPNHDLMRVYTMRDLTFSEKNIGLYHAAILSVGREDKVEWKAKGPRNASKVSDASSIPLEALNPGTKANGSLTYDQYLADLPQAQSGFHRDLKSISPEYLCGLLNSYSSDFLDKELSFLGKLHTIHERYLHELEHLRELSAQPAEGTAILRIGWGGGWKAMTGDGFTPQILEKLLTKKKDNGKYIFRMSKYQGQGLRLHFPKSRRIILQGGEPRWMAGWVLLRFDKPYSEEELKQSEIFQGAQSTGKKPSSTYSSSSTPLTPLEKLPKDGQPVPAEVLQADEGGLLVKLLVTELGDNAHRLSGAKFNLFKVGNTISVKVTRVNRTGPIQSVSYI